MDTPYQTIIAAAAREVLSFKKGQTIFQEGVAIKGIYFLHEGAVKVHRSWGKDRELILSFAAAGDVIGHRGQGGSVLSPVSATALEPTTACFIPNDFLDISLKTNPTFLYAMMQLYADALQKAEARMHRLALTPVKGRVAEALFALRGLFGTDAKGFVRLPITRSDMASYAGTTYEAVFRALTEWTAEGIVVTSGKQFRIVDEQKLGDLLQSV